MDYMREQDCETKWYLGVLVEMVKLDKEGEIMETIHPMFQSSLRIQIAMYGFQKYNFSFRIPRKTLIKFLFNWFYCSRLTCFL